MLARVAGLNLRSMGQFVSIAEHNRPAVGGWALLQTSEV